MVYFTVMTCSFAEIYHIEVSVSWLLMAVIVSTLVVIALPPIPGADILGYSILFSSLGIPGEALVLATGIDILMDLQINARPQLILGSGHLFLYSYSNQDISQDMVVLLRCLAAGLSARTAVKIAVLLRWITSAA